MILEYSLADKIAGYNYQMMTNYEVYITWIHHPSSIFVRPATITEADLATLEVAGDPITRDEIIEGKIVVYYTETLNKLIRGELYRIIHADGIVRCAIYAIDYGFYDLCVPFFNIFDQGGDTTIRPLATQCRLSNCFPVGDTAIWPVSMATVLKMIIGEPTVKIFVRIPFHNYLFIDLFTKNQLDVGKWMVQSRLASATIWFRRDDNDTP